MRSDVSQVAEADDVSLPVTWPCPVVEHVCATLQAHWDAGTQRQNGTSQKRSFACHSAWVRRGGITIEQQSTAAPVPACAFYRSSPNRCLVGNTMSCNPWVLRRLGYETLSRVARPNAPIAVQAVTCGQTHYC